MEKFTITNRYGLKIVGLVFIPKQPVGIVFVIHGLGAYKEQPQIQIISDTFFDNNYIVVSFDTTNSHGESDGNFEKATFQGYYEDLEDVIKWAKQEKWYQEPFILAGSSIGGYCVLRYAESFFKEVKAIFPKAAVVSGKLSYERTKKYKPEKLKNWQETGWLIEESESKPGNFRRLPWSHMEERLQHDVLPEISKITMPTLLLVGGDDISHIEDQKILFDAIPKTTEREFHIVKGAPHTFRKPEHLAELGCILDAWIKKLK
jgi:pimeloyl-ACP methyl ester carboxylesterase